MTLDYLDEAEFETGFDKEELARLVIEEALREEQFPYECEVSLTIVDADAIHAMNRQFRGIDSATDVLSFPMLEFPSYGDFSQIGNDPGDFDNDNEEIMLGDIVLCKEKILAQAEEFGHSVKREFSFLIAHSMLHLMGYDHVDDDERKAMEDKQNLILNKLGLTRDMEA